MSRPVSDTAAALIKLLELTPHPEGGYYRQTYIDKPADGSRGKVSLVLYLLQAGEVSHWHRVLDGDEMWLFQAGSPLELSLSPDGQRREDHLLGTDVANGEQPQILVPQGVWQAARSLGLYTLIAAMVTPAFKFESFEMAPPGWAPSPRRPRGPARHLSPPGMPRRR